MRLFDNESGYSHNYYMVTAEKIQKKETSLTAIEDALIKLNKEGDVILAQTSASHVPLPEIREKLDWAAAYNDARANRI